jgi:DNA-binding NarL/FixJ family response regulator
MNATVVMLEDHRDTSALYFEHFEYLAAAGFSVLAPRVDQDVVQLVAALTGPAAVVVEIGTRGEGAALVQQLAALRPRPALIAVSARSSQPMPNAVAFDACLVRPCPPEDVVDAVRRALAGGLAR